MINPNNIGDYINETARVLEEQQATINDVESRLADLNETLKEAQEAQEATIARILFVDKVLTKDFVESMGFPAKVSAKVKKQVLANGEE